MKLVFENCAKKPDDAVTKAVHGIFDPFLSMVDTYGAKSHRAGASGYSLYTLYSKSEKEIETRPLNFFMRDDGLLELDRGGDLKNLVTTACDAKDPAIFMLGLAFAFACRLPQSCGKIIWKNVSNQLADQYKDRFVFCSDALLPSEVHGHNSHFKGRDYVSADGRTVVPHLG